MALFSCGGGGAVWQNKNPTADWQWGSSNLGNESEPDCRAGQRRVRKQQIQIQVAIHDNKIASEAGRVKCIFPLSVQIVLVSDGFAGNFKRSMPFPLAHPAAVLPLRRFCPRSLNFPALIIGSLTPDLGYFSGHFRLGEFSHRLFQGSFGFCLPAGLLIFVILHFTWSQLVKILPMGYRPAGLRLWRRPAGSPLLIVVSLLLGAWTHILLDSITHQDGWLVEHLPILQVSPSWFGQSRFAFYDFLYAACTFTGVAWLAFCYLCWLEQIAEPAAVRSPAVKWVWAVLLAGAILLIAECSRGPQRSLGIISAGIITLLLVCVFLWGTERWFGIRRRRRPYRKPIGAGGHTPRPLRRPRASRRQS